MTSPAYTITEYTRDFARSAGGYTGDSPAMLDAFEKMRRSGIRQARAGHFERLAIIEQFKANPAMYFAAIRPNLSTEETIEEARRVIFRFRSLPTWQQESRRPQLQKAVLAQVYARYFRRFGRRLWVREAA